VCRETFRYHCIEYIAQGKGELHLGDMSYELKAGIVFSYGPGIPHVVRSDSREPLIKYFVDFSGVRASALLKDSGLPMGSVAQLFPVHCLISLFDELIQVGLDRSANCEKFCSKLLECIELRLSTATIPAVEVNSRAFNAFLRCRSLIERDFVRLRTLEQIASECGMDGAYACRLFQKFGRESPYHCLLRLKINKAIQDLQTPGALVKDVAAAVGFRDPSHFSRLFHKSLGAWPSDFQKVRSAKN
jgi:AraC-like DNA-binding protein